MALNAAVEATRAGEAGPCFALAADEVLNLAIRAADSAKTTAELIEGTVKKVNGGSDLVKQISESFANQRLMRWTRLSSKMLPRPKSPTVLPRI
jgi:methyl-accepting chemotaxis protein